MKSTTTGTGQSSQVQSEDDHDQTEVGEKQKPLAPPGWLFHGLLLCLILVFLWSASSPTGGFEGLMALLWVLCLGFVWLGRFMWKLIRDWSQLADLARWYIAPAIVGLALVMLILDVPIKARFAVSRSAFAEVVASAPASEDYEDFDISLSIGSYEFDRVYRVWDGVIFHSESFHDGGFAYLPNGPTGIGYPLREVRSLGNDWYYWSHSW